MESKHTPGPWSISDGFIVGRFHADNNVHDIADPRCAPSDTPELMAEMDANAALIAAAPAMLEALELLASWFDRGYAPLAQDWTEARAAIAQARGSK